MIRNWGKKFLVSLICVSLVSNCQVMSVLADETLDTDLVIEEIEAFDEAVETEELIGENNDSEFIIENTDETELVSDVVLDEEAIEIADEEAAVNEAETMSADDIDDLSTDEGTFVKSWDIGKVNPSDVVAKLYDIGDGKYKLVISGNGDMTDAIYEVFGGKRWDGYPISAVVIEAGVTSIGRWAFEDCSGLTSISIPSSVTSIGDYAFSGCSSLTSISIPSSVTSIGDGAFSYCSGLTSITIPGSVTGIGDYVFDECSSLKLINNMSNSEDARIELPNSYYDNNKRMYIPCSWYDSNGNEIYSILNGIAYRDDYSKEDPVDPDPSEDPDKPYTPEIPEFKAHSIADAATITIAVSKSDIEYTGTYIKPAVKVTYKTADMKKATTLTENADYKLAYINNKNASTDSSKAKVRVYGIGEYCDSVDVEFTITPRDIANKKAKVAISALPEFVNSADVLNKVKDALNVTYNNKALVADTDYDLKAEIPAPIDANGTKVTATITGKGNYKGSKTVSFKLYPAESTRTDIASTCEVILKSSKPITYTGKLLKPAVVVRDKTTKKALKTKDYKIYYYNNVAPLSA